jgi:cyclic pyranopterin monophosphate synthase
MPQRTQRMINNFSLTKKTSKYLQWVKISMSNFARMSDQLSHISGDGQAAMVDVSKKTNTKRRAIAEGRVFLPDEVLRTLQNNELISDKGPVFQTAIIAGIMGAKKTGELIPLCHPLGLDNVKITIRMDVNEAVITAQADIEGKTGVEMEALTAVSIAALTIYDMCKAVSHSIEIRAIRLMHKSGGKHEYNR